MPGPAIVVMIPLVSTLRKRALEVSPIHIALRIDGESFRLKQGGIHGRAAVASRPKKPAAGSTSGHQVNDSVGCNLAHAAVQAIEIDGAGFVDRHSDGKGDLSLDCRPAVTGMALCTSTREGCNGAIRRNLANAVAVNVRHIQLAGRTKGGAGGGVENRVQRGAAIADLRVSGRRRIRQAVSGDGRNNSGGRYHAHATVAE